TTRSSTRSTTSPSGACRCWWCRARRTTACRWTRACPRSPRCSARASSRSCCTSPTRTTGCSSRTTASCGTTPSTPGSSATPGNESRGKPAPAGFPFCADASRDPTELTNGDRERRTFDCNDHQRRGGDGVAGRDPGVGVLDLVPAQRLLEALLQLCARAAAVLPAAGGLQQHRPDRRQCLGAVPDGARLP